MGGDSERCELVELAVNEAGGRAPRPSDVTLPPQMRRGAGADGFDRVLHARGEARPAKAHDGAVLAPPTGTENRVNSGKEPRGNSQVIRADTLGLPYRLRKSELPGSAGGAMAEPDTGCSPEVKEMGEAPYA